MKVTLNNRLIPPNLRTPVERLVQDHSTRPKSLLISYRNDPCEEAVVEIEPEDETTPIFDDLHEIRRFMEEGVRGILNKNGALNAQNLKKPDARIWVRSLLTPESINGLTVEFSFGGNPIPTAPEHTHHQAFGGTLTCSGMNDYGEISVRLVTNQPLEDENGREVYQVDLDQPSVDSLHQNRDDGKWSMRLPDRYRPGG